MSVIFFSLGGLYSNVVNSDCEAKEKLLELNSIYQGVENKMRVRVVSICT